VKALGFYLVADRRPNFFILEIRN